ncbi:MAG: carbohydrate ABC transporter permease [Lachnospiraceae bacterium]|nr:carbohydrate ABC transporter permease [Lachnospiraceae bacterium]
MAKKINLPKIGIHLFFGTFCVLCVLPLFLVISISFTSENFIRTVGYSLFPTSVTLEGYRYIFINPMEIIRAYGVTIFVTVTGTIIGLWCTTALAYVASRPGFRYARFISFYVFFTMLFSGGLVPGYLLVVRTLGLKNSIFALILPILMQGWYFMLMKGFLRSLPHSVVESAKIDGASEMAVFVRIVLPMSKSGIATVGLFLMLQYWNDWFLSLLYIEDQRFVSLQYLLYRIMQNIEALKVIASKIPGTVLDPLNLPSLSARMAMCVVAAGPMVLVFLFMQKYFIKGIAIGSVKG